MRSRTRTGRRRETRSAALRARERPFSAATMLLPDRASSRRPRAPGLPGLPDPPRRFLCRSPDRRSTTNPRPGSALERAWLPRLVRKAVARASARGRNPPPRLGALRNAFARRCPYYAPNRRWRPGLHRRALAQSGHAESIPRKLGSRRSLPGEALSLLVKRATPIALPWP